MDSREVNKAIKREIRPLLREAGFSEFTDRAAWRYLNDRVETLIFQSFNSNLAAGIGCTTFSFGINQGILLDWIPFFKHSVKEKAGKLRPAEYSCHIRRQLLKQVQQEELKRRDVWFVREDGSNLRTVIDDARTQISQHGLPWFESYRDVASLLEVFASEEATSGGSWGWGSSNSANNHLFLGFTLKQIGRFKEAASHLQQIVDWEFGEQIREEIREALAELSNLEK